MRYFRAGDTPKPDMARGGIDCLGVARCRTVTAAVVRRAEMGAALQYLAWNFDLWLGRIVAVLLASAAITVDTIAAGEARDRDSRGRPLPLWQGCKIIAAGEVFLMNWQSADSLDGRYFGVLPTSAIIGRAKPLWTSRKE
jgi:hypothetical protein